MKFINTVIQNGYAEKTLSQRKAATLWYIQHHGVYHPKKDNKIRVVFDFSAHFEGQSLNIHLLQGPDFRNNLTGVLCSFHKEPVALMYDIKAMFSPLNVSEECWDLLRFLWWENGDTSREPQEKQMTVHPFNATSSPGCCNCALKTTANNKDTFGLNQLSCFAETSMLMMGSSRCHQLKRQLHLLRALKGCASVASNVRKFTFNKGEVIEKISEIDRVEDVKNLEFHSDTLPMEHALGVQ